MKLNLEKLLTDLGRIGIIMSQGRETIQNGYKIIMILFFLNRPFGIDNYILNYRESYQCVTVHQPGVKADVQNDLHVSGDRKSEFEM